MKLGQIWPNVHGQKKQNNINKNKVITRERYEWHWKHDMYCMCIKYELYWMKKVWSSCGKIIWAYVYVALWAYTVTTFYSLSVVSPHYSLSVLQVAWHRIEHWLAGRLLSPSSSTRSPPHMYNCVYWLWIWWLYMIEYLYSCSDEMRYDMNEIVYMILNMNQCCKNAICLYMTGSI